MQQIGRLLEVAGVAAVPPAPRARPLFGRPALRRHGTSYNTLHICYITDTHIRYSHTMDTSMTMRIFIIHTLPYGHMRCTTDTHVTLRTYTLHYGYTRYNTDTHSIQKITGIVVISRVNRRTEVVKGPDKTYSSLFENQTLGGWNPSLSDLRWGDTVLHYTTHCCTYTRHTTPWIPDALTPSKFDSSFLLCRYRWRRHRQKNSSTERSRS